MNADHIEFYTTPELHEWLEEFNAAPPDVITLPEVPFNFHEILRELQRREHIADITEELRP